MRLIIVALFLIIADAACGASRHPQPGDYLVGPFSTDPSNAIRRAKNEGRPVWIVAWDDKFIDKEPKNQNIAKHTLGYFYQNPETRRLIAENFVQVFTTLSNSSIKQWIDSGDKTHAPVFIVLDKNGDFLLRKYLYANPVVALRDTEAVIAKIK